VCLMCRYTEYIMKEQGERFDGWRKSIVKLVEMDEKITLSEQMEEENVGTVILINKFNVKPEEVDQLLRAWAADAEYFKSQPGFISTQLHRGIAGSSVLVNYAVWESTELYKRAFKNHEFQPNLERYPLSTVASPHIFKKVAVPGICVD
jgi:heme-degrading monooxygenase HmoA